MVNKADFSTSIQFLETQIFIQELLANDSAQGGSPPANGGAKDPSPAAKLAQGLLSSKEPVHKGSQNSLQRSLFKFANLVRVFPSLKALAPTTALMLKGVLEEVEQRARNQPSQSPLAEESLSVTVANVKTVLSVLYYFAKHIDALRPESFDALNNAMRPLLEQLIQPVKKNSGGEGEESKHREVPTYGKTDKPISSMERRTPVPSDIRQKPEKALGDHAINRNSESREYRSLNLNKPPAVATPPRIQEEGNSIARPKPTSPSDPSLKQWEKELVSPAPMPQDRAAILAAPFNAQHPISTAPYKKKKKAKDPREPGEESLQDEEDPFQEENL